MNLTVITEPPFEPVTLADVYRQLRLDPDDDGDSPATYSHPLDPLLTGNIKTARRKVEGYLRRSLVQQTLRLSTGTFPAIYSSAWATNSGRILLHRPPFIGLSAVSFYDGDNVLQTLSPSDYYVTDDVVPELLFVSGFSGPTLYGRGDALRIEYVAGYAPTDPDYADTQAELAENVPQEFKDAILIGVEMLQTSTSPADYQQLERMQESILSSQRILLTP